MKILPQALQGLLDLLSQLPGLGPKSAERLIWYWLKVNPGAFERFLTQLQKFKTEIDFCPRCHFFRQASEPFCAICLDSSREKNLLCVVEDPFSIIKIEKSQCYRGLYHVLGGVINLPAGITPDRLNLGSLKERIQNEPIDEVILVFNSDWEGESTAIFVSQQIQGMKKLKVTRLAQGVPMGVGVTYLDDRTLRKAFENRVLLNYQENLYS